MSKELITLNLENKTVHLYSGDLAFIPYQKLFGPTLNENSGYLGIIHSGGMLNNRNFVKFNPFYYLSSMVDLETCCKSFKKFENLNSLLETTIPSIISGTPKRIAFELMKNPYGVNTNVMAEFIRQIQNPYCSSMESLIDYQKQILIIESRIKSA